MFQIKQFSGTKLVGSLKKNLIDFEQCLHTVFFVLQPTVASAPNYLSSNSLYWTICSSSPFLCLPVTSPATTPSPANFLSPHKRNLFSVDLLQISRGLCPLNNSNKLQNTSNLPIVSMKVPPLAT